MAKEEGRCAECDKPASTRCTGCIEGVDVHGVHSPTFYCSKACQITDWSTHKSECEGANYRKQLYRTGGVLQKLLYQSRQKAWDWPLTGMLKKEGSLFVEVGKYSEPGIFVNFPGDMFENDEDKYAMLSVEWRDWAVTWMHKLVLAALEGSYSKLEEVSVSVQDREKRVFVTLDLRFKALHSLFKIKLKDGNSYALDLTGAQYGRYRTVTPWATYQEGFVTEIREYCPDKSTAEEIYEKVKNLKANGANYPHKRLHMWIQGRVANALEMGLRHWIEQTGESVAKMIGAGNEVFALQSKKFEQYLGEYVEECVRLLNAEWVALQEAEV